MWWWSPPLLVIVERSDKGGVLCLTSWNWQLFLERGNSSCSWDALGSSLLINIHVRHCSSSCLFNYSPRQFSLSSTSTPMIGLSAASHPYHRTSKERTTTTKQFYNLFMNSLLSCTSAKQQGGNCNGWLCTELKTVQTNSVHCPASLKACTRLNFDQR